MKIPLDLTFVIYDEDSSWAHFLALITLSPFAIFIAQVSVFFARREWISLSFLIGQLLNAILAIILKKIIRQDRPSGYLSDYPPGWKKAGFGMPSEHAMFMFYFAIFLICFLWNRLPKKGFLFKFIWTITIGLWTCTVCYSRLFLGVHSVAQLVMGGIGGSIFAIFWFWFSLSSRYAQSWIPFMEQTAFGRFLSLKDVGGIEDVLALEYQVKQAKSKHE